MGSCNIVHQYCTSLFVYLSSGALIRKNNAMGREEEWEVSLGAQHGCGEENRGFPWKQGGAEERKVLMFGW